MVGVFAGIVANIIAGENAIAHNAFMEPQYEQAAQTTAATG
jgi:hypothetical protein